jgi:hypothetical protein
MRYEEAFERNIGLFSNDEQDRIRNSTALIAGVGGVGGIQAVTLARFGIGKLVIIDPGEFDPPDLNRQYGATASTMGKNKAESTAAMLRDVNPFLTVDCYGGRPPRDVLDGLVGGASIVVDAIDYSDLEYKIFLAQAARRHGLFNLTCPIPDFAAEMIIFAPHGMKAEEFYGAPDDPGRLAGFRIDPERFFGKAMRPNNIFEYIEGRTNHISTNAGAAVLSGALLATEAALILSGKRPKDEVVTAPRVTYFDLLQRICMTYNVLES